MAEVQPAEIVEGATTGDVQDEIDALSKSPEDRKAANTLSTLGIMPNDDSSLRNKVDQKAVKQAMDRLTSQTSQNGMVTKREVNDNKVVKKLVKVDPAHVAILIKELEVTKAKATDMLRAQDGNITNTLRAYVTSSVA